MSYATTLTKAKDALDAILDGRVASYTFAGPHGSQTATRLDLKKLEEHIEWLEGKVAKESTTAFTQPLSFGGTQ